MPNSRANSARDQHLAVALRLKFCQTRNLNFIEAAECRAINRQTENKQQTCWNPRPPAHIEMRQAESPAGTKCRCNETCPDRQDPHIRAPPILAPALDEGVHHE